MNKNLGQSEKIICEKINKNLGQSELRGQSIKIQPRPMSSLQVKMVEMGKKEPVCKYQNPSRGSLDMQISAKCKYWQISTNICKYLQISANICKYLQISVNIKPPPREKFAAGNCKCNNQLPFPLSVDLFLWIWLSVSVSVSVSSVLTSSCKIGC